MLAIKTDGQETSDDTIVRKAESLQEGLTRAVERVTLWELRFQKLAEIAGEDAAKEAMHANPTDDKMKLLRWLDPKGDDWLGTGMNLREHTALRHIQEYQNSFASQLNDEQRRRLNLIIRLSAALDQVLQQDNHGTAHIEWAIESIIKGASAKDHDEKITWMLDHEGGSPLNVDDETRKAWDDRYAERDKLWAPAVAIAREYTDAFKSPPDDRPRYDTWEEMVEREPGLVSMGDVWVLESEAYRENMPHGSLFRFRGDALWFQARFEVGVRWRGPRLENEHGYWHMASGAKFPDDPDKFWGNNYHRIYRTRDLSNWYARQRNKQLEG